MSELKKEKKQIKKYGKQNIVGDKKVEGKIYGALKEIEPDLISRSIKIQRNRQAIWKTITGSKIGISDAPINSI